MRPLTLLKGLLLAPREALQGHARAPAPLKPLFATWVAVLSACLAAFWRVLLDIPVPSLWGGTLRFGDLNTLALLSAVAWAGLGLAASPFISHFVSRRLGGAGGLQAEAGGLMAIGILLSPLGFLACLLWSKAGPTASALLLAGLLAWSLRLAKLHYEAVHGFPPGRALLAQLRLGAFQAVFPLLWFCLYYLNGLRSIKPMQEAVAQAGFDVPPGDLPPERNAALRIREAAESLRELSREERDLLQKALEDPSADRQGSIPSLVREAQPALEAFRRAARLPESDFTEGRAWRVTAQSELPRHRRQLDLARLALHEARLLRAQGRSAEAAGDYATVAGYARHLGSSRLHPLSCQLVRMVLLDYLWRELPGHAGSGALEPGEAAGLLAALRFARESNLGLQAALADKLRLTEATLMAMAEKLTGILYNRRLAQEVLARLAELNTRVREGLQAAARSGQPAVFTALIDELARESDGLVAPDRPISLPRCYMRPDKVAHCLLFYVGVARYERLIPLHQLAETQLALLQTGLALRLYESERGGPPAGLSALAPGHLPSLPEDPFDAPRSLRYRRRGPGWTLYSVGPDRKDQGGTPAPTSMKDLEKTSDQPPAGDLVWARDP